MKHWTYFILAGHKLRKHAIIDGAIFRIWLEDSIKLDHLWNVFKVYQPQPVECQQPHADHVAVAWIGLPVHGNPNHIGHDL